MGYDDQSAIVLHEKMPVEPAPAIPFDSFNSAPDYSLQGKPEPAGLSKSPSTAWDPNAAPDYSKQGDKVIPTDAIKIPLEVEEDRGRSGRPNEGGRRNSSVTGLRSPSPSRNVERVREEPAERTSISPSRAMGSRSVPRDISKDGRVDVVSVEPETGRGRSFSPNRAMGARSVSISRVVEESEQGEARTRG